jgi:hypothetical protein
MNTKIKLVVVFIPLIFIGSRVCCNRTVTAKACNNAATGTSLDCGLGGGHVYQSFLASSTVIDSIAIQLRAGGSYPISGYTTSIKLRSCSIDGTILSESSVSVPGPLTTGKQLYVTFTLPVPVHVPIGKPLIIEWRTPPEGGSIFSWMVSKGNTYPDGTAIGCSGTSMPDEDFIFQVMPL